MLARDRSLGDLGGMLGVRRRQHDAVDGGIGQDLLERACQLDALGRTVLGGLGRGTGSRLW
jgi:hypothetical protein